MNLLNKTFYYSDYKHGGRTKTWGKILDITELHLTVYRSSLPLGSKTFQVSKLEFAAWLKTKLIFRKERKPCHIES